MQSELILFYNVENFFPPDDKSDGKKMSGLFNWDAYKYNLKLRKINNVFRLVEEDFGKLPSVIGLAEIGDICVLEDLKKEDSPIKNYEIIYEKSNDSRGLSVALLYNPQRLILLQYKLLNFPAQDFDTEETRDILEVEFLLNHKKIHVFVLHLPSKRLQDAKKDFREYIFDRFKKRLEHLFETNEAIIIMGDFNENPSHEKIKQLLLDRDENQVLENPFESFFSKHQFTSFHRKNGVVFDQFLYSKTLLNALNYSLSAGIFDHIKLRNGDRKNNKFPLRTYSGTRYMGGYSDHFPIILQLKYD